jgi:hypothetical protein
MTDSIGSLHLQYWFCFCQCQLTLSSVEQTQISTYVQEKTQLSLNITRCHNRFATVLASKSWHCILKKTKQFPSVPFPTLTCSLQGVIKETILWKRTILDFDFQRNMLRRIMISHTKTLTISLWCRRLTVYRNGFVMFWRRWFFCEHFGKVNFKYEV